METKYLSVFNIILILILSVLLSSCSKDITNSPNGMPESFLSPKYENESFKNVSMDICYPKLDFNMIPGSDTTHIQTLKNSTKHSKNSFLWE